MKLKEKIMFKKSVLAVAIAGVVSQGQAATWDTGGALKVIHGVDEVTGTSELTGVVQSNALVRLGSEYAINDTMTFTYDVAKATNASWPNSYASVTPSNSEGIASCAALTANVTTTAAATLVLSATKCNASVTAGDLISVDSQTLRVLSSATKVLTLAESFTGSAAAGTAAITFLNPKVINLGLKESTESSATYRVASFSGTGTSTVNATVEVPKPNISPAGLVAAGTGGQNVSFSASGPTDTLAAKTPTASTVSEFAFTTVTAFSGIVDVEDSKNTFTTSQTINGTATDKGDHFEYTLAQTGGTDGASVSGSAAPAAVTHLDVVATKTVLDIPGDWTYLDSNATTAGIQLTAAANVIHADNNTGNQETGVVNTFSATGSIVMTGASAEMIDTDKNTVGVISAVAKAILPAQTYAPVMTVTYTTDEAVTTNTKVMSPTGAAGSWTLNGANVSIYGVPYGDTVSRFLWVNNSGATAGAIEATVVSGGSTYGPYTLATSAAAKSATEVGSQIDTALAAAGVTLPASSRANITLSVPVKAADVTVSAAYKHIGDADRLSLETSDTTDGTAK
jgi:hypothetical protein